MSFLEGLFQGGSQLPPNPTAPSLESNFDSAFANRMPASDASAATPPSNGTPAWLQALGDPSITGADPMSANIPGASDQGAIKGPPNFLQRLGNAFGIDGDMTPQAANQGNRRSLVDVLGGLADTVAKIGGVDPQYQPGIDARVARYNAQLNNDWQQKFNAQKFAAGNNELQDTQNTRMGQAVRGLSDYYGKYGAAGVQHAWPLVAQQLGIDPNSEQGKAFGQALQTDPAGILQVMKSASTTPQAQGSLTSDIQNYNLLHAENPALTFTKYMADKQQNDNSLSDKDEATLALARQKFAADRSDTAAAQAWLTDPRNPANINAAANAAAHSTKAGGNAQGIRNTLTILDNLQKGFDTLHGMGALAGENSLGAFGRLPFGQAVGAQLGNNAAQKRLEVQKNASMLQQAIIKSLPAAAVRTKTEQDMITKSLPDPMTMSYETASNVIAERKREYQLYLNDLENQNGGGSPAPASGGRPVRPGTPPPRNAAPAKILKYNPATGRIE